MGRPGPGSADEATYTYTPSGTAMPARNPERDLQTRVDLLTSVTPMFKWNQITDALRYRVRTTAMMVPRRSLRDMWTTVP